MLEKWTSFRPNLFQQIFFSFGRSARVYFLGAKCFLSVELMNVQLLFWDLFNLQITLWIWVTQSAYANVLECDCRENPTETFRVLLNWYELSTPFFKHSSNLQKLLCKCYDFNRLCNLAWENVNNEFYHLSENFVRRHFKAWEISAIKLVWNLRFPLIWG